MKISIPDFCLLLLVASSTAEVTAFARRHFAAEEIIDPASDAWPSHAAHRLARREPIVIIGDEVSQKQQIDLIRLAKRFYAQPIALVLSGLSGRPDQRVGRSLDATGFRPTHLVRPGEPSEIQRVPLPPDLRHEHGPFDIIGDVHGCADELEELLGNLGYRVQFQSRGGERSAEVSPPAGRRLIFVGDFVDRGPRSPDVLRIVMATLEQGHGFAVPGNHDAKFIKWLRGSNVRLTHGLDLTAAQFEQESAEFRERVREFLLSLPHHLWLENGRLVVAHAGILEEMIGRAAESVREFCLYGDTDGETDATGLVVHYHWAAAYQGEAAIVYGHTPVPDAEWVNSTICIDTGCVFGGKLTALRWPEREVISVPAWRVYTPPGRPFGHPPVRPTEGSHSRQNSRPRLR